METMENDSRIKTSLDFVNNTSGELDEKLELLIRFYPKRLKALGHVNDVTVKHLWCRYKDTIEILLNYHNTTNNVSTSNPRTRLRNTLYKRAQKEGVTLNLSSEDIILPKKCPILDIPMDYSDNSRTVYCKLINEDGGYEPENLIIISREAKKTVSDLEEKINDVVIDGIEEEIVVENQLNEDSETKQDKPKGILGRILSWFN
jgi:hypothetical protein